MSPRLVPVEQWQQVKALFDEALALAAPARATFVIARSDDPRVRQEVLKLLAAHDGIDDFLEGSDNVPLPVGRRLGPYEIRAHLGGGGMGDVYRAHDLRLARDVALKVIRGRLMTDEARGRFQREARAIAALSHPNVLAIHDVGDAGGVPYLVTELLEGETLRARLRRGVPPAARAVSWATQIALGLAAAHGEGLVHRDLKPENIFVLRDGRVKILDFGLARPMPGSPCLRDGDPNTLPGLVVGTAGYLAPEQARCQPAVPASDLFALGAILFELLTGSRAYQRDTVVETLQAVLEDDPPPPSTLRPGVPLWLDRVVARCLAKEPGDRFQSARDLAFVLEPRPELERPTRGRARRFLLPAMLAATLVGLGGFAVLVGTSDPHRAPPRLQPLTFSGKDRDPTVSPDGRFLAFVSDRDGRSRIWLQRLDAGSETALTGGLDDAPRFSPDGSQVLFTRSQDGSTALYRTGLLGGEVHEVVADASQGDWSPDGRQVVFVRWSDAANQARPALMVAAIDGSSVRELARLEYRQLRPRWSPDGKTIAVTGLVALPGAPQRVHLVPVDGTPPRALPTAGRVGLASSVAWDGPGAIIYSEALSVNGNNSGSMGRVVRQRIDDGSARTLLWTMENSLVLDRWPGRGLIFDARSSGENLREVLPGSEVGVDLSHGLATDRQPVFSPDGESVVFTSNRGGNLDIWKVSRQSGAIQRLTDDPADDWDPSLGADGQTLLFSSNRSGNLEIWMADADGAHARQVTHDGVDAENPSLTRDGQWVIFACGAPGRAGIWRIRPDGRDAALLAPGGILPDVSPDGKLVVFQSQANPGRILLRVVSIADGEVVPFEIKIDVKRPQPPILGRARWTPDGRSIAFLGHDAAGRTGVFAQPFVAGEDTSDRRRPLAGFGADRIVESFAVAGDGERLVLAEWDRRSAVVAATGLDSD